MTSLTQQLLGIELRPPTPLNRAGCVALDHADRLSHLRARFALPEGVIYLDGNSLGALPAKTAATLEKTILHDWGRGLIGSWNSADWVNLPRTTGAALSRLLGAAPDEVLVGDSTSVNIFKLLAGVLTLPHIARDNARNVIISERGNFPTDLYIAEGLNALLGDRYVLRLVEPGELVTSIDATTAAVLITQVDYCTGHLHEMATINAAAKKAGTHVVWDLSHSAGALPLNLNTDGAEFAVGCGYKYLNGGPGAPGYLYVEKNWHARVSTPLSGWFGHQAPFQFAPSFVPAENISRFQCGTPSILSMIALGCGIDTFDGVEMADVRAKSLALTDLFWQLMEQHCDTCGFTCVAPRIRAERASQLSFAHDHAYPIMQALIARGVVGDFRQPNLIRFGFTPLYTRFVDCWDAVMVIRDVMLSGEWRAEKHHRRKMVT